MKGLRISFEKFSKIFRRKPPLQTKRSEAMSSNPTPQSSIRIDGRPCEESDLRHIWSECVGAGRANEALRADWQRQFTEAVDALGFRYLRFHGIFHDDMFVYRESYGGGFGPNSPLASPVLHLQLRGQGVRLHPGHAAPARSSSSGSCPASWRRRPRRCSGGARTAARPRTWRAGSNWSRRRWSTGSTGTASPRCANGGSRCGTSRTSCPTSGPGRERSTSSSTSRPRRRSSRSTPN